MKKRILTLTISIFFTVFMSRFVFGQVKPLDDLDRSIKDIERSMRQDSLRDVELQKNYQLAPQKIKSFTQDMTFGDLPTTDKAMEKNQERLQKMLDAQKKTTSQSLDDWGMRIPKKYRLFVELFAIGIFVSFFSFIYYKRRVKKGAEAKKAEEDSGFDDGIKFYKT
ncbi:MAG: hypothetical protein ABIA97_01990 [Candidatus Omnitrophota bacterium]